MLKLGRGSRWVEERYVRNRKNTILVAKAPVVVEPEIEGMEDLGTGFGIIFQGVLYAYPECRKEKRPREPLLVHHVEASRGVSILDQKSVV